MTTLINKTRQLTLGTTYYNNPEYLSKFIEVNLPHVDELIIVDDGSPIKPAINYIPRDSKIKFYRVMKDYGFNSHGCRNLIMKESSNDWVILIDIDRRFVRPAEAYDIFRNRRLSNNTLYKFSAYTEGKPHTIHQSMNEFIVHRDHFMKAGGYDEEYIGVRTGDRQYFAQLEHYGPIDTIVDVEIELLRRSSLVVKDNFLSPNDKRESLDAINIVLRRIAKPEPNKKILTFEWERVF